MAKFTASENEIRKSVFDYNRHHVLDTYSWKYRESPTKKFGNSKVVRQAIIDSNKRIEANRKPTTIREQVIAKLKAHANSFASCLPSSGYSMGEMNLIKVKNIGIISEYDNCQEYAKSCSYRATHGHVEVTLPLSIVAKAENWGGLLTITGKQIQKNIWKAQWIKFSCEYNGRGIIKSDVTYEIVEGYVAQYNVLDPYDMNRNYVHNYHFHASTLAEAREALKRGEARFKIEKKRFDIHKKEQAIRIEKEKKAKAKAQLKEQKELEKEIKKMAKNKIVKDALNHMYVYADSIKAGNCVPGTNAFIEAHNLQKTDSRSGAFLLRISKGTNRHSNVVRIIFNYIKTNHPDFFGFFDSCTTNKAFYSYINSL